MTTVAEHLVAALANAGVGRIYEEPVRARSRIRASIWTRVPRLRRLSNQSGRIRSREKFTAIHSYLAPKLDLDD
jgi:hypothetical protein